MSLLSNDEVKVQQRINELERKLKREKDKRDKKLIHQKIVLGAFLLDMLEHDKVPGLREFTVDNLDNFLSRKSDKADFKPFIDNLKKHLDENDTIICGGDRSPRFF